MTISISKYKIQLVKEEGSNYLENCEALTSPDRVASALNEIFNLEYQTDEHFVMFCLNTKNRIIGAFEVCIGTIDSSLVNIRGIIQRVLLCNASRIIVAHNHPSGDPSPSRDDKITTKKIKDVCDLMGISLLDHIIIGEDEYFSFKCEGLL